MPITPLDMQTSIVGSQGVSEAREKQQGLENIHRLNPSGDVEELDEKLMREVNETEPDQEVDPDEEKEKEEEKKKKRAKAEDEEEDKSGEPSKSKKQISDGVRGRRLDFTV